ncbi:MAG: hypothetical protein IKD74_00060 [Clostridia bacterium]|nr:hypothetical protein [Clostridia bacterium]
MKRDLHFRESVLFEAIKMTTAQASILVEKGCTDPERLQQYIIYYSCIAMKAYSSFYELNKEYTGKEMAIKKYHTLYVGLLAKPTEDTTELVSHLKPDLYSKCSEDEQFLILALCNLYTFFKSKSVIKTKHILNTYIPKIRACLKSADEYVAIFDTKNKTRLTCKSTLFKFLVENG